MKTSTVAPERERDMYVTEGGGLKRFSGRNISWKKGGSGNVKNLLHISSSISDCVDVVFSLQRVRKSSSFHDLSGATFVKRSVGGGGGGGLAEKFRIKLPPFSTLFSGLESTRTTTPPLCLVAARRRGEREKKKKTSKMLSIEKRSRSLRTTSYYTCSRAAALGVCPRLTL